MCLIIWRTPKQNLSDEFLEDVWFRNKDGWGIMWTDRLDVHVTRGLDYPSFIKAYRELEADKKRHMLIHFRMNTHGLTNIKNCHPFKVTDNIYLMHNGIIDIDIPKDDKESSDTKIFVKEVLRPLFKFVVNPLDFVRSSAFKHIMNSYCAEHNSRLAIMDLDGPVFFGEWFKTTKDVWVSNQYAYTVDNKVSTKYIRSRKPNEKYDYLDNDYNYGYAGNSYSGSNSNAIGYLPRPENNSKPYTKPNRYTAQTPRCIGWQSGYYDAFHNKTYDLAVPENIANKLDERKEYSEGYRIGYSEGVKETPILTSNDKSASGILNSTTLTRFYEEIWSQNVNANLGNLAITEQERSEVYSMLINYGIDETSAEACIDKLQREEMYYVPPMNNGTIGSILLSSGAQIFPYYVPDVSKAYNTNSNKITKNVP